MQYGKRIVTTSYFKGEVKKELVEIEESIIAPDKSALLKELLAGLSVIDNGSDRVVLEVHRDSRGFRIVKRYTSDLA